MELRTSFDLLSEVIASYEAEWGDVLHVEMSTGTDSATLRGSLELPVRYCGVSDDDDGPGLTPDDVELQDDGGMALTFAPTDLAAGAPSMPAGVTTTWEDARIDDQAGIVVSVGFAIRPAADQDDIATHPGGDGGAPTDPVAAVDDRVDASVSEAGDESPREATADGGPRVAPTDGGPREARADDGPRERPADDRQREGPADGGQREPTGDAAPGPRSGDETNGDSPADELSRDESGDDAAPDPLAEIRNEDVPPFEDGPYLQGLYETCPNFVEMSERIEMDVSAETVRRYMIEAGVHNPDSYDTREDEPSDGGEDRSDEATRTGEDDIVPVPDVELDPDRFGLPQDMSIEETIDAVVDSRSLHEVTRHLDIDHDQARDLLRELDLLDFVSHRLVDAPEAEATYEEVASRIRRSSPQTV